VTDILLMHRQVAEIDLGHVKPLGLQSDDIAVIFRGHGNNVHVHAARQNLAVVVVGVVAADLCSSRCGKQSQPLGDAEDLNKLSTASEYLVIWEYSPLSP
jgi:hypothetical protein